MSGNLDSVREKIRKLLNLSKDDAAATGEAENALRFARKLMLQHNIDESELKKTDTSKLAFAREMATTSGTNMSEWETWLASAIVELIGTIGCYRAGYVDRRDENGEIVWNNVLNKPQLNIQLCFYGPAQDAADAKMLWEEWTVIIVSLGRMKFGGALKGAGRSYCTGFARALLAKVREIKAEEIRKAQEARASGGTGLMVINALALMADKKNAAKAWLAKEQQVRLQKRSTNRGSAHDPNAYHAGAADGQKANFSREQPKMKKVSGL